MAGYEHGLDGGLRVGAALAMGVRTATTKTAAQQARWTPIVSSPMGATKMVVGLPVARSIWASTVSAPTGQSLSVAQAASLLPPMTEWRYPRLCKPVIAFRFKP